MRYALALFVTLSGCGSEAPTQADQKPRTSADVAIRAIVGGCALDWRLTSDSSSLIVRYEVGESDRVGSFSTSSSHYFSGSFQTLLNITDDWAGSSTSGDRVFASLWVDGRSDIGSVWGRPLRVRRSDAFGSDGKPDCWLE